MTRNRTPAYLFALLIFVLDQGTKVLVEHGLNLRQRGLIELLPIFDLRWVENYGISLGLLIAASNAQRWLLVAMTSAIAIGVAVWIARERNRFDAIALGAVLGGALGNILARVRLGYVVDFADLHFGDWHPFLVFNVADAAITIGVLLLLVRALLMPSRKDSRKEV